MTRIIIYLLHIAFVFSIGDDWDPKQKNVFSSQTKGILWLSDWKFRAGDDPEWCQIDYSCTLWDDIELAKSAILNSQAGIYWYKTHIEIQDSLTAERYNILLSFTPAAFEVYWDGVKVLQNGIVGTSKETEKVGHVMVGATIPRELLKPGRHHISIRVSNFHFPNNVLFGWPRFASYKNLMKKNYTWVYENTLVTTVLLMSAAFCIILYFGIGRKPSFLFFVIYCLSFAFKYSVKFYSIHQNLDYGTWDMLMSMMGVSYVIGYSSLLIFLILEFNIPYKKWMISFAVLLSIACEYLFLYSYSATTIGCVALAISSYALWKREPNSLLGFIGTLGLCIYTYLGFENKMDWGFLIGKVFFITSMIIANIRQVYKRLSLQHSLQLRSARLENQLLKKNIQPHFLMNSLVSLQQLLREAPSKAEKMIDSLADEFHLFSKVSEKKLIPLVDELKICEAHLRIMEFRKDATFTLETIGLNGTEEIPPAIFHTLIENGISHGYGVKNKGQFILDKTETNDYIQYDLFNDGDVETDTNCRKNGTGLKYIRARLNESYENRWELTSGPVENGWKVTIKIKKV